MTARLMADSTDATALPNWVSVKAFYINGRYAAPPAVIAAWRGPKVLINVTGAPADGGNMIDVENGDATPADIPGWFDYQLAHGGRYLGAYSNRDNFAACTTAIGSRHCHRWLATLDGTVLHTFDGIALDACQAFGARLLRLPIDLSVIFNDAWHPGWDTDIPNPDLAELLRLSAVVLQDAGAVHARLKAL